MIKIVPEVNINTRRSWRPRVYDLFIESYTLQYQILRHWVVAPFWGKILSFQEEWVIFIPPISLIGRGKKLKYSRKCHFRTPHHSQSFSFLLLQFHLPLFKLSFLPELLISPIFLSLFKSFWLVWMLDPGYGH